MKRLSFFVEIMVGQLKKHGQGTGRKYSKCIKTFQPNMSAQAQKFEIFEKQISLGVHSPWS